MKKLLSPALATAGILLLAACTPTATIDTDGSSSVSSLPAAMESSSDSSLAAMEASSDSSLAAMEASSDSSLAAMEASSDSSLAAMEASSSAATSDDASSVTGSADARIIEMSVTDWEFKPNAITVKKGEKVIVRLTDVAGGHSFASRDLGINVVINPGETKDIEIPTGTEGTFAFRCAVPCGPGHKDMTGTIVVEA